MHSVQLAYVRRKIGFNSNPKSIQLQSGTIYFSYEISRQIGNGYICKNRINIGCRSFPQNAYVLFSMEFDTVSCVCVFKIYQFPTMNYG